LADESDALVVESQAGKTFNISTRKYNVVSRAGKGHVLFKRGSLVGAAVSEPTLPGLPVPEDDA